MLRFFLILCYLAIFKDPTVVFADDHDHDHSPKEDHGGHGDHPWCYMDPKCEPPKWEGLCKTGTVQSPINIDPFKSTASSSLHELNLNRNYFQATPEFYIKNNGHTIQVQINEETTSNLLTEGADLPGPFRFSQLHFHWGGNDTVGSEHTISGKSYPLEAHLVHYSDRYDNILEAVSVPDNKALAVFGIFFELSQNNNLALRPIMEALDAVIKYHPDPILIKPTNGLNFSAFFPDVLDVYRYQGSLTTPSCGEKVIWTVFRRPVPISRRQLDAFRTIKDQYEHPLINNFRPTQPLIGRIVKNGTLELSEFEYVDKTNEIDHDDVSPNEMDSEKSAKNKNANDESKGDAKKSGAATNIQTLSFTSLILTTSFYTVVAS